MNKMPERVAVMYDYAWVQRAIQDRKDRFDLTDEDMIQYGEWYEELITFDGQLVEFVKWDDYNYVVHLRNGTLEYSTYPWNIYVLNEKQKTLVSWKKRLESLGVGVTFKKDHLICNIGGTDCYRIDNQDDFLNFLHNVDVL